MKSGRVFGFLLLVFFLLISSCQDDKASEKKDAYSGMAELIADRNKARQEIAKNSPSKKSDTQSATTSKRTTAKSKTDEISTTILYEQKINVVGAESGRVLASGVAYINKQGQIVRIKITKE